jgi:putative hydrolase of the HAD superfamily
MNTDQRRSASLPSPSAVIFDYGNVLSQSQPIADTQAMAGILDLTLERFTDLYWQFRVPYDSGTLAPTEYWNTVAETAARAITAGQADALIEIDSRSWSHPDPVTPQWARRFRDAGLRTAILSNMPAPVRDYVLGCSWLPEFDARVFSCEGGVCKPEPEIYRECLNKLEAKPSEVLFLDDRESNIRAARALGLHAVLFTDVSTAAREIERSFSLPVTLA